MAAAGEAPDDHARGTGGAGNSLAGGAGQGGSAYVRTGPGQTVLASTGNAVFDDPDTADPAPRIGAAMQARFGFLPELFLYTPAGFAAICAQNPFTGEAAADGAKVHAFFLARPATLPAEAAALGGNGE